MKVLVYRKCSTCMKALKWLDEHNISYEERAIKVTLSRSINAILRT